jgi:thiamine biosynthesis lipoprotein
MRIVLVLLALAAHAAHAETVTIRGATMGTTYQIKLADAPAELDADGLQAEVNRMLAEIDMQMSTYRPDSELSRFNRAKAGKWFAVSPAVAEVTAVAREISAKTDGALDVTVGPLVKLWHFGPKSSDRGSEFVPPTEDAIRQARQRVGYEKLEVRRSPPALRKQIDGIEVDLSSIASGYAIDQLSQLVAKREINNFMVEIGGEVRARGKREDGRSWRVAVERPTASGKRELAMPVSLMNAAIATAGDYRKFFEFEGRRYSHVIDPATGRPVKHSLASVTVVADTCMAADGWDTPLLVLGPKRGFECAEKNGVAALFIAGGEDSAGSDHVVDVMQMKMTSAWRKRVPDQKP